MVLLLKNSAMGRPPPLGYATNLNTSYDETYEPVLNPPFICCSSGRRGGAEFPLRRGPNPWRRLDHDRVRPYQSDA